MSVPQAATDIVRHWEGCRLKAYRCPAGIWTCGWGHTGADVGERTVWTLEHAVNILQSDLEKVNDRVNQLVKVPLTDNQRAALLSLVFNIGGGSFKTSTLLKRLNEGKYAEAADQFPRWVRADGKVLNGLVERRMAERQLFLKRD